MMDRRIPPGHLWQLPALLLCAAVLVVSCLRPPEGGAEAAEDQSAADESGAETGGYYGPTWGDSSGADGKGGVKLEVNSEKRLPLVGSDYDKEKRGDAVTEKNSDWLLFHGPGKQSLAFKFVWVTKPDDKFFANTWAGGGLAFNESWVAIDGNGARYLVLWVKSNVAGVNLAVHLQSVSKAKGKEGTGMVELPEFVSGGQIDDQWRRVVIPLSEFSDLEQVDLSGLQQVIFTLKGGFPENEPVTFLVDNVYLTNIDMVTPVANPGYLVQKDGVLLRWRKDPGEKIKHFAISVDGKVVLKAKAQARSALVPRSAFKKTGKSVVGIATVGTNETSEPQKLRVNPKLGRGRQATVKLGSPAHDISPYIFGINFGPGSSVRDLGVTVRRWGGNRTTKYNWKRDVDSAGVDWFYLNDYGKPEGTPEKEKKYYEYIRESLDGGAEVNFCIPISTWVAKAHEDPEKRYCSFPASLFPDQQKTDGQGCGNGIKSNGEKLWVEDPSRTMVKNSPELQAEFVRTVVGLFGPASRGGVKFYSMDNEPGLWMHTHRDTMPQGVSAEQLAELNLSYAKVVKDADPSAQVLGFGAWGMLALAGSNIDYIPSGPEGYKREKQTEEDRYRERKKHGGDSQLVYLLKRFKAAERKQGKRLIDIVDIHWYPELYGKDSKGKKRRVMDDLPYDKVFSRLQWEAIREWYDPTFKPTAELESWAAGDNAEYLWDPHHPVLPALKGFLEKYYPGTKLAVNEYDTGSPEHYHGALIRAAVLGIFMQEDLYMAQNWHQTDHKKFVYWAQKLYGNYDDKGARVKGKFVATESTQPDLLSYAARDGARFTVVLINKNPATRITTTLELPSKVKRARTFTLVKSMGLRLHPGRTKPQGNRVRVEVPAYSAVLVEAK